MLNKPQKQINSQLSVLRTQIVESPLETGNKTQQVLLHAEKILYQRGIILAKVIISRCHWCNMSYTKGLKVANEAAAIQDTLDSDEFSSEINHVRALHHFGLAEYFTAQHHWNVALEQAALNGDTEIELEGVIGLGNVWRLTNESKMAATAHQLAIDMASHQHQSVLEKKAHILLAIDLYEQGEYLDMLMSLDSAEELLVDIEDPTWKAEISDFRGLAMLELGRYLDAERATQQALDLCEKNELIWMSAHALISRARYQVSQKEYATAQQLLDSAEKIASTFDNGEIMAEIHLRRSQTAEQQGQYKTAFEAYKNYSDFSLRKYLDYTSSLTQKGAAFSKGALDQRSQKLLHRLRHMLEGARRSEDGALIPESSWWEKLILFKTQLDKAKHSVVLIRCYTPEVMDTVVKLLNCSATENDALAVLNDQYIGLLLSERDQRAEECFVEINQLLAAFPWQRHQLPTNGLKAALHPLIHFPFTLEQLTDLGE